MALNLFLTPRELGNQWCGEKEFYELVSTIENSWIPQQFENDANPEIHKIPLLKKFWQISQKDLTL